MKKLILSTLILSFFANTFADNREIEGFGKIADAVDLGLSVKWASWNVGASSPEEYGIYFAWGETVPKDNYDWSTYKYGTLNFSKYNSTDGLAQLELEDDAAHVTWGKGWRMPTHDEELELANKCSWESTELNGISGYKITGPNGNSIFMPRGGLYDGTDYACDGTNLSNVNYGGWYWSSTLNSTGSSYAQGLCFFPSLLTNVSDHERCDGHNIRPVNVASSSELTVQTNVFDANSQPPIVGGVIDGCSDGDILKRGIIVSSTIDDAIYKGNENWYDTSWYFDIKDYRIIDCTNIGDDQFWCSLKLLKSDRDYYVRAFIIKKDETISLGNVEILHSKTFNRNNSSSDYANVWYAFTSTLFDLITDEIIDPNEGFYYSTNENPTRVRHQVGTGYNTCYKYATEWNYKLWYYHNVNHCDNNKVVSLPIMSYANGKLTIEKNPLDTKKDITIYYSINGNYFRPETYTDVYTNPIEISEPCAVYCYAISSDGYISYTNMYVIGNDNVIYYKSLDDYINNSVVSLMNNNEQFSISPIIKNIKKIYVDLTKGTSNNLYCYLGIYNEEDNRSIDFSSKFLQSTSTDNLVLSNKRYSIKDMADKNTFSWLYYNPNNSNEVIFDVMEYFGRVGYISKWQKNFGTSCIVNIITDDSETDNDETDKDNSGFVEVCGIKWAKGNLQYDAINGGNNTFHENWRIAPTQWYFYRYNEGTTSYEALKTDKQVDHFTWGVCGDWDFLHDVTIYSTAMNTNINSKMFVDADCKTETTDYESAKYGDIAYWASKGQYRMPTVDEINVLTNDASYQYGFYLTKDGIKIHGYLFTTPNGNRTTNNSEIQLTSEDLSEGLFLPMAGSSSTKRTIIEGNGSYWCSTAETYPQTLWFDGSPNRGRYNSYYGQWRTDLHSIRPVYVEKVDEPQIEETYGKVANVVDLGLSVKWASWNIGSDKPEGLGNLFAWGELTPKTDYSISTYKIYENGYTKYGSVDNKYKLDDEDDVARQKWGEKWRIPTIEELKELKEKCTFTKTELNGVPVTKVTGPNNNYIYFPYPGNFTGTTLYYKNSIGSYWSSDLESDSYAKDMDFLSGMPSLNGDTRYHGQAIRPVYIEKLKPIEGDSINYNDELNDSTNLSGTVIGNIYYSISDDKGEYNSTEGCIVLKKGTNDDQIDDMEGNDIFGEDFKNAFTGIVFMVQGNGAVKVNAETVGCMTLKVKIGNNAPISIELEGKMKVSLPYNVTKPTYVYIYCAETKSAYARGGLRARSQGNALKIYGIEWNTTKYNADMNGDSVVDVADIATIISSMAEDKNNEENDVNGDGVVDVADIASIISIMAK